MTLFTFNHKVIEKGKRWTPLKGYLAAAVFCLVFARIYALYSHGVSSYYMTFLFLLPLIGGGIASILRIKGEGERRTLRYGIGVLTMGSALKGILEIAGTDSQLLLVYPVVGGILLGLTFILHFIQETGTITIKK